MQKARRIAQGPLSAVIILALVLPAIAGERLASFADMGTTTETQQCYSLEEFQTLSIWVEELDRYDALAAAHESLVLSTSNEVAFLRKALDARELQVKALEDQNKFLHSALVEEMAKPRLPYPKWFEPIRIGLEVSLTLTVIVETALLVMAAKGMVF